MGSSQRIGANWGTPEDRKFDCPEAFIREDRFTTEDLPPHLQFESVRQQVEHLGDLFPVDAYKAEKGFSFDARGYDLGKVSVSTVCADSCRFKRGMENIRRDGLDHWVLSYRSRGNTISKCGERTLHAAPQTLFLTSLAYPFQCEADVGGWTSLYIRRDNMFSVADRLDRLNHTVLDGVTALIAKEFLMSMTKLLPVTPMDEVSIFVETAMIIMKGVADQSLAEEFNPSRPALAVRLEMVKRFIQENLTLRALEPDDICAAMKLSRRQLYYLFEELGGVSAYIRSRRMLAFHEAITNPTEDRPIHVVAGLFGFHDAALFSRQFKAQFGYSPKEAREANISGYTPLAEPPKSISQWLSQVREVS